MNTNTYRGEETIKSFNSKNNIPSKNEEKVSSKNLKEKIMEKMKIIEKNEKLMGSTKIEKNLKNQNREKFESPVFRCEKKIDNSNRLKRFRNEQTKQNHDLTDQIPAKKVYFENQKRIECKISNNNRKEKETEFFTFDEEKIFNSNKIRSNLSPFGITDRFISKNVSKERNRENNQRRIDCKSSSNRKKKETEFFIFEEEKICNSHKTRLSPSPFASKNVSKERNWVKRTETRIEISNLSSSRKKMKEKKDKLNGFFNSKENKFSNIPIKRLNIEETDNESTINLSQSPAIMEEKQRIINSKSWIFSITKILQIIFQFFLFYSYHNIKKNKL